MQVTITYLQMLQRPVRAMQQPPRPGLTVVQALRPTASFYRFLYNTVGEPWHWVDRWKLTDAALLALLHKPGLEVHVLYVDGTPAGYAELDFSQNPAVKLEYFGIMPEFIGQKLGPYFLDWAIRRAWSNPETRRFWLHTCTLDHPSALPLYQKAGFSPYKTETTVQQTD